MDIKYPAFKCYALEKKSEISGFVMLSLSKHSPNIDELSSPFDKFRVTSSAFLRSRQGLAAGGTFVTTAPPG
jgi:hypothetical protein